MIIKKAIRIESECGVVKNRPHHMVPIIIINYRKNKSGNTKKVQKKE